jgi:hypothetical protein
MSLSPGGLLQNIRKIIQVDSVAIARGSAGNQSDIGDILSINHTEDSPPAIAELNSFMEQVWDKSVSAAMSTVQHQEYNNTKKQ